MIFLENKGIHHHYEILESFEAGIVLLGWEVKTLRKKHGSLKEAYVSIDNELWLTNAYIPLYQPEQPSHKNDDPYRKRKLLLSQKQIQDLKIALKQQGLTIVPIRMYNKGNLIKVEIAIARGKKLYDKRKDMKERTAKRDSERAMRNG